MFVCNIFFSQFYEINVGFSDDYRSDSDLADDVCVGDIQGRADHTHEFILVQTPID